LAAALGAASGFKLPNGERLRDSLRRRDPRRVEGKYTLSVKALLYKTL